MFYKIREMENEEKKFREGPESADRKQAQKGPEELFRSRISHNKALMGIFIVIIGIALLLKQIPGVGQLLPDWLFTWPMILIIIGAFVFLKNGFGGLPFIVVGLFFLLREEGLLNERIRQYVAPIIVICIGIIFILKRNQHQSSHCRKAQMRRRMRGRNRMGRECDFSNWDYEDKSSEDYIDINSVFGSTEKSMFTKSYKGGNINCAFGGAKINLSQADIDDRAILNVSVAFGGAEIIVPANWQVQNDLTAILGGIEDNRRMTANDDNKKTLILRGGIFCGGVEIKN